MRTLGWDILIAALIFFFGAWLSWFLFSLDPTWFNAFNHGEARNPDASYEYLRSTIYTHEQDQDRPFFRCWPRILAL